MKIRDLRIVSMPGFPRGGPILEGLSGGMNVIVGANGAGKTTFARAVRWLLWPSTADRSAPRVVSARTFDNIPIEINQSHAAGQSQLKLPPASHADCFTITADDLFDQGTATFAERVKHAITGQVSVNALYGREELARSVESELENLHRLYERKVREIEGRHGQVVRLPEFREQLAEASRAERRLVYLSGALEKRKLERTLAAMKGMESVQPTDLGNAQRLGDSLGRLRGRAADLAGLIETGKKRLAAAGLEAVPEALGEIRRHLETLRSLVRKRDDIEDRLAGLAKKLEGVPVGSSLFDLDAVMSAGLAHEGVADGIREIRSRIADIDGRLGAVGRDQVQQGRSILARWLARREHRDYIIPAGVLLLAVLLISEGNHLPAVLATVVLTLSLIIPAMMSSGLQRRYAALHLRQPDSWAVHDVLRVIAWLEDARADFLLHDELSGKLAKQERELGPAITNALRIREKLGVSSSLGLELLADRMKRLDELDELKGHAGKARADVDACLEGLGSLLSGYGYSPPGSLEAAENSVESLEARAQVLITETRALEEHVGEMKSVTEELSGSENEYNEIFRRNRLEVGDMVSLRERDDRLQDYRDVLLRLGHLEASVGDVTESMDEIEEGIRNAAALAESVDGIRKKVTLAEEMERELEKSVELAELLSAIQRAERKREQRDSRNRRVRIRKRLLDTVKKMYQVEIQPPVVGRASGLLTRFTNGRYSLSPIGLEDSEFAANDMQTDTVVSLSQLSRGTRMQLLLALKIAFAELVETGDRLPLVLDEVLANSDLTRFREVARSLAELVQDGRQLFYLTCQEPDASLIGEVFSSSGCGPVRVVRIDSAEPAEWPRYRDLMKTVPIPGSLSYDEFAGLVAPSAINSGMNVGEISPAWILNDKETLHRLLSAGLDTVGKALAAGAAVLSPGELEALGRASLIAGEVFGAHAIGRPEPLTRSCLERSPAGRSSKFEELWALSGGVGHDPARLLSSLRARGVPGFRTLLIDELETFLRDESLLSEEEPLSKGDAWVRVLNAAGGDAPDLRLLFERLWNALQASAG